MNNNKKSSVCAFLIFFPGHVCLISRNVRVLNDGLHFKRVVLLNWINCRSFISFWNDWIVKNIYRGSEPHGLKDLYQMPRYFRWILIKWDSPLSIHHHKEYVFLPLNGRWRCMIIIRVFTRTSRTMYVETFCYYNESR